MGPRRERRTKNDKVGTLTASARGADEDVRAGIDAPSPSGRREEVGRGAYDGRQDLGQERSSQKRERKRVKVRSKSSALGFSKTGGENSLREE